MEVPFSDRPILEVKLTDAFPEAFEMVLNYIYTDRIDCKYLFAWIKQAFHFNLVLFKFLILHPTLFSQGSIEQQNSAPNDGHLPIGRAVFNSSLGASFNTIFGI